MITITPGVNEHHAQAWAAKLAAMFTLRYGVAAESSGETWLVDADAPDCEHGVHRWVGIPDDDPRRYTCFAAVATSGMDCDPWAREACSYIVDPYQRYVNHVSGTDREDVQAVLSGCAIGEPSCAGPS